MRTHHGWRGLDCSTTSWKPYSFRLRIWKCSALLVGKTVRLIKIKWIPYLVPMSLPLLRGTKKKWTNLIQGSRSICAHNLTTLIVFMVILTWIQTVMNPVRRHQSFHLFKAISMGTTTAWKTKPKQTLYNQVQLEQRMAWSMEQEQSDLFAVSSFWTKPVTALPTEASVQNEEEQESLVSCPICFSLHPVEQIKEHADNCLMWLLDDTNDQCDIFDPSPTLSCNAKTATAQALTGYQQKKVLREQIAALFAQLLSTDVKRITIGRKFLWQDFKSAMWTKIQPKSTLTIVFSGEPAVDDGGKWLQSLLSCNS